MKRKIKPDSRCNHKTVATFTGSECLVRSRKFPEMIRMGSMSNVERTVHYVCKMKYLKRLSRWSSLNIYRHKLNSFSWSDLAYAMLFKIRFLFWCQSTILKYTGSEGEERSLVQRHSKQIKVFGPTKWKSKHVRYVKGILVKKPIGHADLCSCKSKFLFYHRVEIGRLRDGSRKCICCPLRFVLFATPKRNAKTFLIRFSL